VQAVANGILAMNEPMQSLLASLRAAAQVDPIVSRPYHR